MRVRWIKGGKLASLECNVESDEQKRLEREMQGSGEFLTFMAGTSKGPISHVIRRANIALLEFSSSKSTVEILFAPNGYATRTVECEYLIGDVAGKIDFKIPAGVIAEIVEQLTSGKRAFVSTGEETKRFIVRSSDLEHISINLGNN